MFQGLKEFKRFNKFQGFQRFNTKQQTINNKRAKRIPNNKQQTINARSATTNNKQQTLHTITLSELKAAQVQQYLQHAIAPRPICFASTIDSQGMVNLSPYSFFNLVSSNPPIAVFSPARRVRDNSTKHTLQNVLDVPEVVINIVDYDMLQQMSLSSCDFPKEENEFVKAGFTEQKASLVEVLIGWLKREKNIVVMMRMLRNSMINLCVVKWV